MDKNLEELTPGNINNNCLIHFRDPLESNQLIKDKKILFSDFKSQIFSSINNDVVPGFVNSCYKNSNNDPNFIKKIDDNTIGFNVDSDIMYKPLVYTYQNGISEILTSISNISIPSNGTYYIVKEYGSNPYVTNTKPIVSKFSPSSPVIGQLWHDISSKPNRAYKWNGTSWINTQFVRYGYVIKASNLINSISGVINYSLNGVHFSPIMVNQGSYNHNIGLPVGLYNVMVYAADDINFTSNAHQSVYTLEAYAGFGGSNVREFRLMNCTDNQVNFDYQGAWVQYSNYQMIVITKNF